MIRKILFSVLILLLFSLPAQAQMVRGQHGGVLAFVSGDVTPPTLTSATIPSAGTSASLVFSETVSIGAGENAGWYLSPGTTPTTATRAPTSDATVSGTWDGSAGTRYTLVDDYPDTTPTDYLSHGTTTAGYITFGYTAFAVPAGSTSISVQVMYYDYRASGTDNMGARITVGGTAYDSATHQPTNSYAARSNDWTTNPDNGNAAWTVDQVNGVGTHALTGFGFHSTDANPAIRLSCIQLRVTYTPPAAMTYASGSGSNTLVYTLPYTVAAGNTVLAEYIQPENGVEDAAGNDLATIVDHSVVNNADYITPDTINDRFEDASDGYDYAWTGTDGTPTIKQDSTATPPGNPSGWGTYCLKVATTSSSGIDVYKTGLNLPISYVRVEFVITATSNSADWKIFQGQSSGYGDLFRIEILTDGSGNPSMYIGIFAINLAGVDYYMLPINKNQRYSVEFKWDNSAHTWQWALDRVLKDSGSLVGTSQVNLDIILLGLRETAANGNTVYLDNFGVHTLGWIGAPSP